MNQNNNTKMPMTSVTDNKRGNGPKIITAVACLVALFGIGFGVYGMAQGSQKDNQISDLKNQI